MSVSREADPASSGERVRAYRARQREAGEPDSSRRYRKSHKTVAERQTVMEQKPFTGCDGEGCGTDEFGRQLYMLFRMGERELFTGNPLSTIELLNFICNHPRDEILVGFSFGYDVTMILRDLPPSQQKRLFLPKQFEKGHSVFVWYKEYDIDYLPRQYFRVRRVKCTRTKDGKEIRVPIKNSTRTIYETFGFFQCSFLRAIQNFDVGSIEQRESIARDKAARSSFEKIDTGIRDYCNLECEFLGILMEKLRGYCHSAGIVPRSWNGAGKLAMALHAKYNTMLSKDVRERTPPEVLEMASAAYYGGRFEITRTGMIDGKVYEYDIRSAYPDAMRRLPCLDHGRWQSATSKELSGSALYISSVSFRCEAVEGGRSQLGGLPIRSKQGNLFWPLRGAGIYWGCEIESAKKLGFKIRHKKSYVYKCDCNCKPFDWVQTLYDYRRKIGSQGPGYPIKLAINSLYGKLAQRIGNPRYANLIWAGLITALTRSKLNDAIAQQPTSIVMLATDGIYSLSPLNLPIGDQLGDYEAQVFDGMFIVQPGLYWSPNKRKRKSRGLSSRFFEQPGLTERFEQTFSEWLKYAGAGWDDGFPAIDVNVHNFVGLKIAVARGKPETAGCWKDELRKISFDYRMKRDAHVLNGSHIVTSIKPGYAGLVSVAHREMLESGGYKPLDELRAMLEDQQEFVETGPPFED